MRDVAIRVEHLSKVYTISRQHHSAASYDTLRDQIAHACRSLFRRTVTRADTAEFWALQDVTLQVGEGEVVGIIGRNGAGKSTLLKILSRITPPTKGRVQLYGRVGSLLEVGTGFHPELTGRENVFLNGAILGMARSAVARKFDQIVDFAEVSPFIDVPVKRYSSGMYMRLAFSVAAHLETEILIVDEVLAVGDVRFQGKCLTKMQTARKEGRTILFVSHNMDTVARLCERVIVMHEGRILLDGAARTAVGAYLETGLGRTAVREWTDPRTAPGGDVACVRRVCVRSPSGTPIEAVDVREPFAVEMEYDVLTPGHVILPNYHFCNEQNLHLFSAHDVDPRWRRQIRPVGHYVSTVWIPGNFMAEGTLRVNFELTALEPVVEDICAIRDVISVNVIDSINEDSARGDWVGPMQGVIRPLLRWTTQFTPPTSHASAANTVRLTNSR
jgi:lipopolysaccharide transport system ATP-binding protein